MGCCEEDHKAEDCSSCRERGERNIPSEGGSLWLGGWNFHGNRWLTISRSFFLAATIRSPSSISRLGSTSTSVLSVVAIPWSVAKLYTGMLETGRAVFVKSQDRVPACQISRSVSPAPTMISST